MDQKKLLDKIRFQQNTYTKVCCSDYYNDETKLNQYYTRVKVNRYDISDNISMTEVVSIQFLY